MTCIQINNNNNNNIFGGIPQVSFGEDKIYAHLIITSQSRKVVSCERSSQKSIISFLSLRMGPLYPHIKKVLESHRIFICSAFTILNIFWCRHCLSQIKLIELEILFDYLI